jgi:signal transduction histidine kinase
MAHSNAPPVAVEGLASDCAEQAAAAARAAARDERQRLARDLHDSVSQTLVSLRLSAQAAAELWDTHPTQARGALELVRHLASGAATEMRALLVDLHDAVLAQQGPVAALEAHCAVVSRHGLPVELHVEAADRGAGPAGFDGRLPAAHAEALYYIAREALANVVKHARATRATVTLAWDSTVCLVVEDDGVGCGAPAAAFTYGLAGMRARRGAGRPAARGEASQRGHAGGGRAPSPREHRPVRSARHAQEGAMSYRVRC